MLIVKILLFLVSSALFWIGGKWNHNARRFVMPLVLSLACAWGHNWWPLVKYLWIIPAMFIPMAICLSLGYGDKSPLRHIFGDGWGRGVWGILVALSASVGLLVGHFLAWWWFILYLGVNFTLENTLKNVDQDLGDPIIGLGFASIIFLI
jgi:hypothetical protein